MLVLNAAISASMAMLAMLAIFLASPVLAQVQPVPELTARITDTTGTLDAPTREHLTQILADLEQRKGAQIAVLMIPTTGDEAIEQYAVRAFEQWRLGRKEVDDGILFLVAKDDRRMRIEVGYGLEGAVPDLLAGRIIREQVAPRFQQGDFAGGVTAGVNSLVALVEGEDLPPPQAASVDDTGNGVGLAALFLPLLIMVLVLPPGVAVLASGVLIILFTGSIVLAVLGAMLAFVLSHAGRAMGAGGRGSTAAASRRGSVLPGVILGGGLGRGGFGGGFGRGGGCGGATKLL